MSQVHAQACNMSLTHAEIRDSELSVMKLAERDNVSRAAGSKRRSREVQDRSHRLHGLSTKLSAGREAIVAKLRRLTPIPLDDLLVMVRELSSPAISRSGFDLRLGCRCVGGLHKLQATARDAAREAAALAEATKHCEPSVVRIGVCLPQCPTMPPSAARIWTLAGPRARWP